MLVCVECSVALGVVSPLMASPSALSSRYVGAVWSCVGDEHGVSSLFEPMPEINAGLVRVFTGGRPAQELTGDHPKNWHNTFTGVRWVSY